MRARKLYFYHRSALRRIYGTLQRMTLPEVSADTYFSIFLECQPRAVDNSAACFHLNKYDIRITPSIVKKKDVYKHT